MNRDQLLDRYRQTRNLSVELCRPLHPEDYRIQSMPDVSPPWWNLGHTSWFFAKNILEPFGLYRQTGATCGSSTGVKRAGSLTTNAVFAAVTASGQRPRLQVTFAVDANLRNTAGTYTLNDTITLRNASVS